MPRDIISRNSNSTNSKSLFKKCPNLHEGGDAHPGWLLVRMIVVPQHLRWRNKTIIILFYSISIFFPASSRTICHCLSLSRLKPFQHREKQSSLMMSRDIHADVYYKIQYIYITWWHRYGTNRCRDRTHGDSPASPPSLQMQRLSSLQIGYEITKERK